MANYLFSSYNALSKIFKEGAYVSDAVYKEIEGDENADIIYRIVMGVLEKNNELDFKLSKLVDKRPKSAICIVLKQGIYCLDYMDSLPDYAVVNNSVDLAKTINKGAYKGFVNAVLKRAATEKISLPDGDGAFALSIRYGYPEWAIKKIFSEYGREKGKEIVAAKKRGGTHVRTNGLIYSDEKFERDLENAGYKFEKTKTGYYVSMNPLLKKLFIEGRITYQSLTSTYTALALDVKDGQNVLDVCSAPGGKAIFVAEKNPTANVVACDIHPHRVELIGAYARRMHVKNVTPTLFDGTAFNKEWAGHFDRVLCDVPCSAMGVVKKQPDVLLNRNESDIAALKKVQYSILDNAKNYVKRGGLLVYSTCTIFKEENDDNVEEFLKNNNDFENYPSEFDGQYLPCDTHDGFFIRRLRRK